MVYVLTTLNIIESSKSSGNRHSVGIRRFVARTNRQSALDVSAAFGSRTQLHIRNSFCKSINSLTIRCSYSCESRISSLRRGRPSPHFLRGHLSSRRLHVQELHAYTGEMNLGMDELVPCPVGDALQDWILENEGHIHPALQVVQNAPCGGGRGIITTENISADDAANMPLILIPDALYLTSQVAREGFKHYEDQGAPPVSELDMSTQLAVLLAHEKAEGDDSFYHPYINSLPERPPCAWAMTDTELKEAVHDVAKHCKTPFSTEQLECWEIEAQQTRESLLGHSEALYDRYKAYFRPEVTADTYFWALAMVISRAFSSHPELGLAPFIDLMNHRAGSDHPEPVRVNSDDDDDVFFYVTSAKDGYPAALCTGDELFIQYIDTKTTPKQAFLSYGFIPSELWQTSS